MRLFNWLIRRSTKDNLGARGETFAAKHLQRNLGMKVLARNVRCPGGELDIIALDGDDLVFVEVRTRSTEEFTTPEATITSYKKRFLIRAAHWYVHHRQLSQWNPRFDVIAIVWPADSEPVLRYHRNAFAPRAPRRRR